MKRVFETAECEVKRLNVM